MRFIRLRLANYRGIDACEVKFGSQGITLVQGPNEAGKTSLAEAVGLLFEYPDSSKHRNLEAIRPVHRDEGPEVELEAQSGPYAFTYYKRFYKKPGTKLTVRRPKRESHTGREAHQRADAILRQTLDVNLWKALTIQQGDTIHQPHLTGQTSLSAALDRVAGGRPTDPREEGLFERVHKEYGEYFTDRGREKGDLQNGRKRKTDTEAEIGEIEDRIRGLEEDIERAASLKRELTNIKKQEEELQRADAEYSSSLKEIGTLESDLREAQLRLDSARKSQDAALREREARKVLIEDVARVEKEYRHLEESSATSAPALNQAETELKKAEAVFSEVEKRKKEADLIAALRRDDFDYYTDKLHLEQLTERKERIDRAREKAALAEDVLVRNKVNSDVLKAIEEAERGLLAARAQLETGAPSVSLRGLGECNFEIDDAATSLGRDQVRTLSVADRMRLRIPERLEIEITAGSSTESLSRKVTKAERALEIAYEVAGVGGPEEARKAFDERREALRDVESKAQVERENLRDLTYEQLEAKLVVLKRSVPGYLSKRVQKPAVPADLESADKERADAQDAQQKANSECEAAQGSVDAAREVRDQRSKDHQKARVQLDMLTEQLNQVRDKLARARVSVSDDALDAKHAEVSGAVASEESNVQSAKTSLEAKNPERVKALATTTKESLQTTKDRRSNANTELTKVETRLKVHGEEGLHEKLQGKLSYLEHLERENQALLRRASAARCLFETMREERDRARQAYVAPLKEKIEQLGSLVFDDPFEVDINEDLLIVSRTVGGVTVPFDWLSGGTKEQLSLIFRLACSMIVAKDGGTPLILDDALAYTDPDRLPLMGAVLAKAAKECQIIIFTCVPERYANIGQATIVSLG